MICTRIRPTDVPDWVVRETTLGAMRRCVSDGVMLTVDNLKARGALGDWPRIQEWRDLILDESREALERIALGDPDAEDPEVVVPPSLLLVRPGRWLNLEAPRRRK